MMPARRNQNWLPSIFNEIFGNEWMERTNRTAPAVNIIENEHDYCVEVAAPGMTREDFKININEDNELVISMEKRSERQQGEEPRQQREHTEVGPQQGPEQQDREQGEQMNRPAQNPEHDQRQHEQGEQQQGREQQGGQQQTGMQQRHQAMQNRRQGTYLRREFSYSQFQQSLILPDNVDKEKIRARMEHGVLTIEIPKRKEEEMAPASRQIEIE